MRALVRLALALALTVTGTVVASLPPAQAADPLRITASGDFGTGSDATAVLRGMSAGDVALALGDLSYGVPGEESAWCDYVTATYGSTKPFQLLAGNHESNGRNGWINAFAACLPNRVPGMLTGVGYAKEYAIDLPAERPLVRVVFISPGVDFGSGPLAYAKGDARYNWTERTIDSARVHRIPWVIVAQHKPCLSVGTYPCAPAAGGPGPDIANLLLRKRVDLVLQGHEHLYQRTHQLRNGVTGCSALATESYSSACVADRDGAFAGRAGTRLRDRRHRWPRPARHLHHRPGGRLLRGALGRQPQPVPRSPVPVGDLVHAVRRLRLHDRCERRPVHDHPRQRSPDRCRRARLGQPDRQHHGDVGDPRGRCHVTRTGLPDHLAVDLHARHHAIRHTVGHGRLPGHAAHHTDGVARAARRVGSRGFTGAW